MKYEHPKDISAEYLRLAIPFMSKQDAAVDPVSYSVWYEYVSGINPALKKAMDELLKTRESLTNEDTERLFRDYISSCNIDAVEHARDELCQVIQHARIATDDANTQATGYEQNLGQYSQVLSEDLPAAALDDTVKAMLADTRHLRNSIRVLQQDLDRSTHEMDELREELQRVRLEASSDPLTGLANRKALDATLHDVLASVATGTDPRLCIIMLDIDKFKDINDNYGHLLGDKVIRFVAEVLKSNVKGKDTVARYGGEEFVILLPDTSGDGALALAETIRKSIESARIRRHDNGETIGQVTISCGITCYRPGEGIRDFIGRADKALYASKEGGRNRTTRI